MVMESLRKLSLNELLTRLHDAIATVAKSIGKLTEKNREVSLVDIIELRGHIKERLASGENTVENAKLLKLIELFKEDKNALELIKIDLEEWMEFLEAIREHLETRGGDLTAKEERELAQIKRDLTKVQDILRKQQ